MIDETNVSAICEHLAKIAAQGKHSSLVGKALYFTPKKNTFSYGGGENRRVIALGAEFVAPIGEVKHGYTEYRDGKPKRSILGAVSDPKFKPDRQALGDLDRDFWPGDPHNKNVAADPFVYTFHVVLHSLADADHDQEHLFTLILQKSGVDAAHMLLEQVAAEWPEHPDDDPIVALESKPTSDVATFGHRPTLRLIGWTPHIEIGATAPEPTPALKPVEVESEPEPKQVPESNLAEPRRAQKIPDPSDLEMDDEIPF